MGWTDMSGMQRRLRLTVKQAFIDMQPLLTLPDQALRKASDVSDFIHPTVHVFFFIADLHPLVMQALSSRQKWPSAGNP